MKPEQSSAGIIKSPSPAHFHTAPLHHCGPQTRIIPPMSPVPTLPPLTNYPTPNKPCSAPALTPGQGLFAVHLVRWLGPRCPYKVTMLSWGHRSPPSGRCARIPHLPALARRHDDYSQSPEMIWHDDSPAAHAVKEDRLTRSTGSGVDSTCVVLGHDVIGRSCEEAVREDCAAESAQSWMGRATPKRGCAFRSQFGPSRGQSRGSKRVVAHLKRWICEKW